MEPNRSLEFIRASNTSGGNNSESLKAMIAKKQNLLNFGLNPYALSHER